MFLLFSKKVPKREKIESEIQMETFTNLHEWLSNFSFEPFVWDEVVIKKPSKFEAVASAFRENYVTKRPQGVICEATQKIMDKELCFHLDKLEA